MEATISMANPVGAQRRVATRRNESNYEFKQNEIYHVFVLLYTDDSVQRTLS